MLGTAHWYCVRCARFVDPRQTRCEICGRVRGSSRLQDPAFTGSRLYRISVAACHSPDSPGDVPSSDT